VSYRLATPGQKTFPHAVQDAAAAIQYVRGNAAALNIAPDPSRVRSFPAATSGAGGAAQNFAGGYPQDAHAKESTEVNCSLRVRRL